MIAQQAELRSNLGAVIAAQGRYAEAINEYRAALKQAPLNSGIGFNLAAALYKSGDILEAARELSTLQALTADNPQVSLLLSDCWLQMGEYARVIRLLTPLESKRPDDLGLAYMLGTALVREKRVEEGQRLLNRIFAKGDSAEVRLILGTSKINANDFAGALEDLSKAVELNPTLPTVNAYHGQALMATGDTAGAAKAFRRELERNPNDFLANLNLAVILKQDQEYDEALSHLGRALRLRPADPGARYQIATIQLAQAKVDDARKVLEELIAESPNFVEAHVTLATVYYRLRRKEDGDRERAIVERLNAEAQARQPKGDPVGAKTP